MNKNINTQEILNLFNGNPILNVVSLLLAILGLVFTIYFYFKSKKSRNPTYIVRTINLIKENAQKIDTVSILYSGEKVKNLSISKIALWNDGKETIDSKDVALNNLVKIKIKDEFEFLDSEILYQKNKANDFKIQLSPDNKSISISFDYFDFEEGIVIQLFHTGNTSDDIFIDGTIKSVKKILRREHSTNFLPTNFIKWLKDDKEIIGKRKIKILTGWILIIIGFLACLLAFIIPSFKQTIIETPVSKKEADILDLATMLPGLLYIWLGYKVIKRRIPKGFDIFNEEL